MYEVMVVCDCGCDKTAPVPQAGALPVGWVGVTWPQRAVAKVVTRDQGPPIGPGANQIEQRTMVFSSWRCVNKHVKAMLTGADAD